jgi:hypothetical protein
LIKKSCLSTSQKRLRSSRILHEKAAYGLSSAEGWVAVQDLRKSKEAFVSDERILGSSAFVASVLGQVNENYEKKTIAALHGIDLVRLAAIVCDCFNLNPAILKSPSK